MHVIRVSYRIFSLGWGGVHGVGEMYIDVCKGSMRVSVHLLGFCNKILDIIKDKNCQRVSYISLIILRICFVVLYLLRQLCNR